MERVSKAFRGLVAVGLTACGAMRKALATSAVIVALLSTSIVFDNNAAAAEIPSGSGAAALTVNGVDEAVSDSVVRLYLAVFDRQPDMDGLRYWVSTYTGGAALNAVAGAFMLSPEWTNRYGTVDDAEFVDLLYRNVLKRPADDEGQHYWLQTLAGGAERPAVLLYFSESTEFVAKTGTAAPRAPYPPVPPDSGSGKRIVYANTAQRVWMIDDDGTVHDSYPVSGRRDAPTAGTYKVFSKSEKAWAGHDGITMNHMVRFAHGRRLAIGFHSIPTYRDGRPMQTLDQLGTYRSSGCVRQEAGKAEALYHWADIGTTVVVLD